MDDWERVIAYVRERSPHEVAIHTIASELKLTQKFVYEVAEDSDDLCLNVAIKVGNAIADLRKRDRTVEWFGED